MKRVFKLIGFVLDMYTRIRNSIILIFFNQFFKQILYQTVKKDITNLALQTIAIKIKQNTRYIGE